MKNRIGLLILFVGLLTAGFAQAVQIVNAEYFFDWDAGVGHGTPITISPSDSINITIYPVAPTTGFHVLYIRAEDEFGNWGLPAKINVWAETIAHTTNNIARIEYYFDSTSNFSTPIVQGFYNNDTLSRSVTLDCSSLSTGYHTLYLRLVDEYGSVSLPQPRQLWVGSTPYGGGNITGAEYFFDSDPGLGNGYSIPIVAGNPDTVNYVYNLSGQTPGYHTMYTRVKDYANNWSVPLAKLLYVENTNLSTPANIEYAEYFLDNDPGYGNGHVLSVTPGIVDTITFWSYYPGLTGGYHYLYMRVRDSNGNWSLPLAERIFLYPTPQSPQNVQIVFQQPSMAVLTWSPVADSTVYHYAIYRDTTGYSLSSLPSLIGVVNVHTTTFTDSTATGRYYYHVYSTNPY